MGDKVKINDISQYLVALKSYFPNYVVDEISLTEVCEGNGLNAKQCKKLNKSLGDDFFTNVTPATTVNSPITRMIPDEQTMPRFQLKTENNQLLGISEACQTTRVIEISAFDPEVSALFGGAQYARASFQETCRSVTDNLLTGMVVQFCDTKRIMTSKGLFLKGSANGETDKFFGLEHEILLDDKTCGETMLLESGIPI